MAVPILILAEHDNRTLAPATARTVHAVKSLGEAIDILVAGADCRAVAEAAAAIAGISKVWLADDQCYGDGLAEPIAALIAQMAPGYDGMFAPATAGGKAAMPRLAAMLGVPQISEIVRILAPRTFERPIYAGALLQTVACEADKIVATVRTAAFAPAGVQPPAPIEAVAPGPLFPQSHLVSRGTARRDLDNARIVVAGGRGVGSREGFETLTRFADAIDAEIAASRAAVDAGFAANDRQIGQNGRIIAPDLYIAVGISGAIQHIAGVRDAKCVVAINKDPEAPIFRFADIGLVADWQAALPELAERLAAAKSL